MTRTTNARLAGFTFLFYIAAGIGTLVLADWTHARTVLATLTAFAALVLGVTLFSITREEDPDLALLALACRIIEAVPGGEGVGVIFFAVASTIFCWLLLRGGMIPTALAGFGVLASGLLAMTLLLLRAGLFGGRVDWSSPATWLMWLPMLVFEIAIGLWLLIKGVTPIRNSHR